MGAQAERRGSISGKGDAAESTRNSSPPLTPSDGPNANAAVLPQLRAPAVRTVSDDGAGLSAYVVIGQSHELSASWRWLISRQLAARDGVELAPFVRREEFTKRRSATLNDEESLETNPLTARLLDLEAHLHRRTKLSRRQLRLLGVSLIFLLIAAVALAVALGMALTNGSSPSANPCLAQPFVISSHDSLVRFNDLQCTAVSSLSLEGGHYGTSAPNMSFPQLTAADSLSIENWENEYSSLSFPALVRVGPLTLRNVTLRALLFPSLGVVGDATAFNLVLSSSLSFPVLQSASSLAVLDADVGGVLDFPKLQTVTTNLTLHATLSMGDIEFPQLRYASVVDLTGPIRVFEGLQPAAAPLIAFPALEVARGVIVFNIAWTGGIFFPALQEVQFFSLGSAMVRYFLPNGTVSSNNFDVSSLVHASFFIVRATFGIPVIRFTSLERIDTLAFDGNTFLTHVLFPSLTNAGDMLFSTNTNLGEVYMPRLALVTQGLRFIGNSVITNISVPALKGGVVLLSVNVALRTMSLPVLETGSVAYVANPMLREASFPALRRLGLGSFMNNDALSSISMPVLETMSEEGWIMSAGPSALYWVLAKDDAIGRFGAGDGSAISVDLFEMGRIFAGGSLTVLSNTNLTRVDLGTSLASANTMLIHDNPALCMTNVSISDSPTFHCGCFDGENGWEDPACNTTALIGGHFACPPLMRNCSLGSSFVSPINTGARRRSLASRANNAGVEHFLAMPRAASLALGSTQRDSVPCDTTDTNALLRTVRRLTSEVERLKRGRRRTEA